MSIHKSHPMQVSSLVNCFYLVEVSVLMLCPILLISRPLLSIVQLEYKVWNRTNVY